MKLICLNVAIFEPNNSLLAQFLEEQKADFVRHRREDRGAKVLVEAGAR